MWLSQLQRPPSHGNVQRTRKVAQGPGAGRRLSGLEHQNWESRHSNERMALAACAEIAAIRIPFMASQ